MSYDNDPFFIVGCARSGTTILRLMLNEHSRLHVPYESHFVADLIDSLPLDTVLKENELNLAYELILKRPSWGREYWQIPKDDLHALIFGLRQPTLAALVNEVFQISCRRSGKVRWGDKTPLYTEKIEDLHRVFPTSKFVHLIRDARDVSSSLRPHGWHGNYFHQAAYHWQRVVNTGVSAGRKLGSGLYIEISYEDLVLKSEPTLKRVCSFLNEPYEPQMLHFYERAATNIPQRESKFHVKTSRPPEMSDTYRWRKEMNLFQVAIVEAIAGSTMTLVGQTRKFNGLTRALPSLISMIVQVWVYSRPLRRRLGIRLPQAKDGGTAEEMT